MFRIFAHDCHSIPDYYRDLARIDAQRDSNNVSVKSKKTALRGISENTIKVGSLIIKTDGLSKDEIDEAKALRARFKEIDNDIFGLNISLSLNYPDYYVDTRNEDACKNINKEREVTLQEARDAVQEFDGIRAQLQTRLDDAKFREYSESSIPQGIRFEIQNQFDDKKNQQETEESLGTLYFSKPEDTAAVESPVDVSEDIDEEAVLLPKTNEQIIDEYPDGEKLDEHKSDNLFTDTSAADKNPQNQTTEYDEAGELYLGVQVPKEELKEYLNSDAPKAVEEKENLVQGNRKEYTRGELDQVKETDKLNNDVQINPQDNKTETKKPNENKPIREFINLVMSKLNTVAKIIKEIVNSVISIIKKYK